MIRSPSRRIVALALAICLTSPAALRAQNAGGGNGQGGGGQGGGGGQNQQTGGILIDAAGVVRSSPSRTASPKLLKEQRESFTNRSYSSDLKSFSQRRCVSLIQLEAECARQLNDDGAIADDLRYLAGLQRIDYVFVDREANDLIIAGPAEGFAPDLQGRMLGLTTDQPALRLDDLVVALTSVFAGTSSIGCSIDPDPSRLAEMGEYIRNNSTVTSPANAARRYQRMGKILGLQNVSVFGVPEDSHFANVLVEADFRMKRISLGVEPAGIRGLKSHLALLKPNGNSIQRWWFVPYYDAVSTSADRDVFHLSGQRAQLMAQDEILDLAGHRSNTTFTRATTQQFAKMFTEQFPELAAHSPVFAQLQQLFDLAVIAALLKQDDLPAQLGWEMSVFRDRADQLVGSYAVPKQVESESTFRRAGRGMVLGLIGGVTIEPSRILEDIQTPAEAGLRLSGMRREILTRDEAADHPWWWD